MSSIRNSSSAYANSKPHYLLLDGLRGVAALMVLWFHVFEGYASSPMDQWFNHGYLAVDFFFMLSGFVVAYAYDDRWQSMSMGEFFKRRLIRLHPMVVFGVVLGIVTFCVQGTVRWDGEQVQVWSIAACALLALFMIPVLPGAHADVRGNGEMFPLNGPTWSLFFEYVANIMYAFWVRKLSTKALKLLVLLLGVLLVGFCVGNFSGFGHIGVGWTLADNNLPGGLIRVMFPFTMGLLLSRCFRPVKIRGAFWICSLLLGLLLAVPHLGDEQSFWLNGLYDAFCVAVAFPLIVWLGASEKSTDGGSSRLCRFLGDISYPVYVIHYPFYYLFYAWLWKDGFDARPTFAETWPVALCLFIAMPLLAWVVLKLYDEPVRRMLARRFLKK